MGETKIMTADYAVAYSIMAARAKVVAAYPITPQTVIVEVVAKLYESGQWDGKYIRVESEHSAMAATIGASATGVRAFTATASQGLAYMYEMIHWASNSRLPIVMANVNRALAPAWSIHVDQTDSMAMRDNGWIQFYVTSAQEAYDTIIQAYKIAEDERVYLPAMVNLDAFILSHTAFPVHLLDPEEVDPFLPPYEPKHWKLDPEHPVSLGNIVFPDFYMEFRYKMDESMKRAREVIKEASRDFKKHFGRYYGDLVEEYKMDGAKLSLITQGTVAAEARDAIDELRDEGFNVGLTRLRVFRPFPEDEIREMASKVDAIVTLDRATAFGGRSPANMEVRAALYDAKKKPMIKGYMAGLGGRDITKNDIKAMLKKAYAEMEAGELKEEYEWYGLRR